MAWLLGQLGDANQPQQLPSPCHVPTHLHTLFAFLMAWLFPHLTLLGPSKRKLGHPQAPLPHPNRRKLGDSWEGTLLCTPAPQRCWRVYVHVCLHLWMSPSCSLALCVSASAFLISTSGFLFVPFSLWLFLCFSSSLWFLLSVSKLLFPCLLSPTRPWAL